jgi:beta-lactamase regulating signal transducer with metallopeptidase domain
MTFTTGTSSADIDSWQSTLQPRLPTIVTVWSMIAGVLALRMMMGLAWVGRIIRSRSSACDAVWQSRLDQLALAFGIERAIRLRVVAEFQSPVAAGWWRPAVLVPASLIARMPPELLEALLAHELAHIRRHDYLVNMMQSAIEALLFYHPIVWWLSRRIRVEREQIADALAAEALGEPRRLAVALNELAIFQTESPGFPMTRLASSANGGNLMSRIQNLVRPSHHALSWKMFLPAAGLMVACATLAAIGMSVYASDSLEEEGTTVEIIARPEPVAPVPLLAMVTPPQAMRGNVHTSRRPGEAYAVVRAGSDELLMSGHSRDIDDVKALKRTVSGDFLWVRRGVNTYVIQDPAIVARVIEAWEPAENLGVKMEAVGERMEVPSRQMEEIGKRMEAISERGRPHEAEMEELGAKMEAVGREQAALGKKMEEVARQFEQAGTADHEELSRKMEAIQREMEPSSLEMERLGAIMEKHSEELEAALEPMEALGREMELASKPMEALGKEMEVLGAQMEALTEEADQKVRSMIDDALSSGRAVPVDSLPRNPGNESGRDVSF